MTGTTKDTFPAVADSPEAGAPTRAPVQALPPGEVFGVLDGSPRGLSASQVRLRQERYGPNELPTPRKKGLWRRFVAQFTDLFAVVLIIASGLTFLAYALQDPRDIGNLQLALAILAVVLVNAVIGFAQ